MKMLNNSICCKNLDEIVEKVGNVIIPTKDKNYKRLEVIHTENEVVKAGDEIYVPLNAGVEIPVDDEDFVVIKVTDILFIK